MGGEHRATDGPGHMGRWMWRDAVVGLDVRVSGEAGGEAAGFLVELGVGFVALPLQRRRGNKIRGYQPTRLRGRGVRRRKPCGINIGARRRGSSISSTPNSTG